MCHLDVNCSTLYVQEDPVLPGGVLSRDLRLSVSVPLSEITVDLGRKKDGGVRCWVRCPVIGWVGIAAVMGGECMDGSGVVCVSCSCSREVGQNWGLTGGAAAWAV